MRDRFACRRAIVVAVQRPVHASDIKLTNDLETVLAGGCARCRGVLPLRPRNHHFCLIYGPWFLFPCFWPTMQVPSIRKSSSDKRHNGRTIASDGKRYVIVGEGGGGSVARLNVHRANNGPIGVAKFQGRQCQSGLHRFRSSAADRHPLVLRLIDAILKRYNQSYIIVRDFSRGKRERERESSCHERRAACSISSFSFRIPRGDAKWSFNPQTCPRMISLVSQLRVTAIPVEIKRHTRLLPSLDSPP